MCKKKIYDRATRAKAKLWFTRNFFLSQKLKLSFKCSFLLPISHSWLDHFHTSNGHTISFPLDFYKVTDKNMPTSFRCAIFAHSSHFYDDNYIKFKKAQHRKLKLALALNRCKNTINVISQGEHKIVEILVGIV